MKKHLANIITGLRITGSIALLFFSVSSREFRAIYLLCGFTDMIDGTVARKTNSISEFGSKLDTVADLMFFTVSLIKVLPCIILPMWLWIWIGVIAIIKIANIVLSFVFRKKFAALHTVLNKAVGLLLFLLPLTLRFIEPIYSFAAVCAIATAAAVQETRYIGKNKR